MAYKNKEGSSEAVLNLVYLEHSERENSGSAAGKRRVAGSLSRYHGGQACWRAACFSIHDNLELQLRKSSSDDCWMTHCTVLEIIGRKIAIVLS
jgi:hypothetical protein